MVVTDGLQIRGSPWFFSLGGQSMPEMEKNLIIAGSVSGASLFLVLVLALLFLYIRRRRRQTYTTLGG